MSILSIDTIANIASFLPLGEQAKTFPEFNNCIKQVEDKKKLIRRTVYNWRLDYFASYWASLNKADFKRYTPLAIRGEIVERIKEDKYHGQQQAALNGASFCEIVDGMDFDGCIQFVMQVAFLTNKLRSSA